MAALYRRGKIWHFSFTAGGRRHRASTGETDRSRAAEIAARAEAHARAAVRDGPAARLTFAEAAILYIDAGRSTRYLEPILRAIGPQRVATLSGQSIRALALELYPDAGPATRNRQVLTPAQAVINHAADAGLCQPVRVRRFAAPRPVRRAGDWTWIEAFAAAAASAGNRKVGALAVFMFTTGARISQACALRWRDVDLAAGKAVIPAAKNRAAQEAWLVAEAAAALAAIAPPPDAPQPWARVFGYASRHSVQKAWARTIRAGGLEPLTPHEAGRHGFGTQLITRAGMDPATAGRLGRWNSPPVLLETYSHAEAEREKLAAAFAVGRDRKNRP